MFEKRPMVAANSVKFIVGNMKRYLQFLQFLNTKMVGVSTGDRNVFSAMDFKGNR